MRRPDWSTFMADEGYEYAHAPHDADVEEPDAQDIAELTAENETLMRRWMRDHPPTAAPPVAWQDAADRLEPPW